MRAVGDPNRDGTGRRYPTTPQSRPPDGTSTSSPTVPSRTGDARSPEPGCQGRRQRRIRGRSRPGDMAIGTDEHGNGRRDLTEEGELPVPGIPGLDQPDP